ncbi:MAG: hypothetical protein H7A21_18915 [Spirochaetales bacterium]|nr:hypothetical protein [Leptospiraceae bacterium]MCP5483516.1 hypothetical protein [Spirochaetales bacterium]MCP5486732.1 hypothetical protein [Spirochaetales bacterium]
MNWSDLTPKQQRDIEKAYKAGKEPGEIAPRYGLKPKQISDQAYRKDWPKPKKKATKKAGKKKAGKKKARSKKKRRR